MENKLTYKDFEIGQVLICIKLDHYSVVGNYIGGEPDNERLIIGEKYTITFRICSDRVFL
jgi:hypothetical protein